MKCEKAQEIFSEYLEGTLERPMKFMLEHHLESCSACGRDYEKFRATWDMIEALPEVEVPAGFRESVMSEVRTRQVAPKRRAWSLNLDSILGARIQVRAVAMAAAVVLFGVMLVQTSPWNVIKAGLWKPELPQVTNIDKHGGVVWQTPAEAVIDPGLNIAVKATDGNDNKIVYSIDLEPTSAAIEPRAYLMSRGKAVFTTETLDESNLIFEQPLEKGSIGNISVVVREDAVPDVVYVVWKYKSTVMTRAIFLPTNLTADPGNSFSVTSTNLYAALQKVSADYGVVVMVDGSLAGRVKGFNITNGTLDLTLATMLENLPLRWKPAGENVYVVERKL